MAKKTEKKVVVERDVTKKLTPEEKETCSTKLKGKKHEGAEAIAAKKVSDAHDHMKIAEEIKARIEDLRKYNCMVPEPEPEPVSEPEPEPEQEELAEEPTEKIIQYTTGTVTDKLVIEPAKTSVSNEIQYVRLGETPVATTAVPPALPSPTTSLIPLEPTYRVLGAEEVNEPKPEPFAANTNEGPTYVVAK